MKRKLRFCLLLMLCVLTLCVSALADSGPKPQLTVTVKNAPQEVYYLDLLEENRDDISPNDNRDWNRDALAGADQALIETLLRAVPEGWHACTLGGTFGPMSGDICGKNNAFSFGYVGVPDTFRVIIATESGKTWVSEAVTRHALQSSATVDWAKKTVSSPPVWVAYVLEFLATCVPTLLIEGIVLLAFGYHLKKSWKPFLLVNLATQTALYLFLGVRIVSGGLGWGFVLLFIPAELVIMVAEGLLYRHFLTEKNRETATVYAIIANACSAVAGWFLAAPIWNWISSLT